MTDIGPVRTKGQLDALLGAMESSDRSIARWVNPVCVKSLLASGWIDGNRRITAAGIEAAENGMTPASKREVVRRSRREREARAARGEAVVPHGVNGYNNYGCRCEICAEGASESNRAQRLARLARPEAAPHGTTTGYYGWGCKCEPCAAAARARAHRVRRRRHRQMQRLNSQLRTTARRHGDEWTGPELELAQRYDLSARQVAKMTGRTLYAVQTRRAIIAKGDPRTLAMLGKLYR